MAKYFIVNTGSASKKYALYENDSRTFFAHFEKEDENNIIATFINDGKSEKRMISESEYANATKYMIDEMTKLGLIAGASDIAAIGLRVVAPGSYFLTNRTIDAEYRKKLEEAKDWAPLHTASIISEINSLDAALFGVPIVAVSDSAYHATMVEHSRYYGLPLDTAKELDVLRFGYHGISFKSILPKLESLSRVATEKAIVCHLGSGSSIMAFKNGKSFDTSMGFSPLEGLPMSTRVGDIDAAAVIFLEKKLGMSPEEMEKYFNSQCGLLGLSGKTDDIRELINLEANGDERAKLALEIFSYKIKKYIGSYFAALNGADILIFSGTIGERSAIMRSRICREMEALGIVIDEERNSGTISKDGFIHHETNSPVKIAVITTDEMGQMASEISAVLNK